MAGSAPTRVCAPVRQHLCMHKMLRRVYRARTMRARELKNMEQKHTYKRAAAAATHIAITPGWLLMLYFKTRSH